VRQQRRVKQKHSKTKFGMTTRRRVGAHEIKELIREFFYSLDY
jgi:hypothetical protein